MPSPDKVAFRLWKHNIQHMLLNCLSNFQQDSFLRMKVKSKNLYEWLGNIFYLSETARGAARKIFFRRRNLKLQPPK